MKLLTVEDVRERERGSYNPSGRPPTSFLDPSGGECAPLFTSQLDDCLTHLTRWIAAHPAWTFTSLSGKEFQHRAYEWATGWCGVMMRARQIALADASGFCCARCLERAAAFGMPTFGLIPDTGCAVSGGRRGRRRRP